MQDDWENERQLNGEIEVDLVPVETPSTDARDAGALPVPPAGALPSIPAVTPKAVQPIEQAPLLPLPMTQSGHDNARKSEPEVQRFKDVVLMTDRSANTDPISPRRMTPHTSQNDRYKQDTSGRSESDPSISDENIPPANKISRIAKLQIHIYVKKLEERLVIGASQ